MPGAFTLQQMHNPSAVQCRGIVKRFVTDSAEVVALRGVDLDVAAGELMMLVGPSGCGKTTLLSVMAGILQADSGSCVLLGQDYGQMSESQKLDFRARSIGFIFQAFNLLPSLTVAENVAVPLLIAEVPREEALSRAKAMLEEVGLGKRADNKPSQLSGGQQQRVAIARAMVHNPKILLCDEPTSALDHETGMHIMALMQELNKRHDTTLIVVTHDSRIFQYATHIAYMDDGHIERVEAQKSPL